MAKYASSDLIASNGINWGTEISELASPDQLVLIFDIFFGANHQDKMWKIEVALNRLHGHRNSEKFQIDTRQILDNHIMQFLFHACNWKKILAHSHKLFQSLVKRIWQTKPEF